MSDGLSNSAILLLSVGEEEAAQVMKFRSPKEVQKIGQAMTKLEGITRDRIEQVLDAFHASAERQTSIGTDNDEYIRSVLVRALGDDKAAYLLDGSCPAATRAASRASSSSTRRASPS